MESVKTTSNHSVHRAQAGSGKDASSIANPSGQGDTGDFMSMLASVDSVDALEENVEQVSVGPATQDTSFASTDLAASAINFLGMAAMLTPPTQVDQNIPADGDILVRKNGDFFVALPQSNQSVPLTEADSASNKKGATANPLLSTVSQQAQSSLTTSSEDKPLSGSALIEPANLSEVSLEGSRSLATKDILVGAAAREDNLAPSLADVQKNAVNKALRVAETASPEASSVASDQAVTTVKALAKKIDAITTSTAMAREDDTKKTLGNAVADIQAAKVDVQTTVQQSAGRLAEVAVRNASEHPQQWLDRGLGLGGSALQDRLIDAASGKKEVLLSHVNAGLADTYAWVAPAGMADGASATANNFANQLSEQVTYWVNQKVQNAAFTVERDGESIDVAVALNGLEAQISFRADQAQTREMLDSSTNQLKELLLQQGLSLTGVSIDEHRPSSDPSAGGRHPLGEDSKRQSVRNVRAAIESPLSSLRSVRPSGGGYGLDVFA